MPTRASVFPAGDVCIFRFARTFDGVTEGSAATAYRCRSGATDRMTTVITFRITAKMECDDTGTRVPATGLRAKGTTIHRADGFAHFTGRAEIINAKPDPVVVLFRGTLELIARIGSHSALGEPCAPEQHVEGWFAGQGQGDFAKMSLRVVLAGHGELAEGTHAFPDASANRIIGTLIVAP